MKAIPMMFTEDFTEIVLGSFSVCLLNTPGLHLLTYIIVTKLQIKGVREFKRAFRDALNDIMYKTKIDEKYSKVAYWRSLSLEPSVINQLSLLFEEYDRLHYERKNVESKGRFGRGLELDEPIEKKGREIFFIFTTRQYAALHINFNYAFEDSGLLPWMTEYDSKTFNIIMYVEEYKKITDTQKKTTENYNTTPMVNLFTYPERELIFQTKLGARTVHVSNILQAYMDILYSQD
jgi:hypothetical protein